MIKQIKDKIMLAAIAIPVYANLPKELLEEDKATGELTTKNSLDKAKLGDFQELEGLEATSIISWIIGFLFTVSSIIFFFILISGGIKWLTSGGDEKKVAAARASITSALVGLAIVLASWAIIKLIGTLFDINLLQFGLKSFIDPALK